MPRSVNAVASRRRRKKVLKLAKGYFGRKKNVWTVAKNQVEKGLGYAYRDRRAKKREFRKLWIQRINAGARVHGTTYSQLIGKLHQAGIELNRKVLADLAMHHEAAFASVVEMAMNAKPVKAEKVEKAPKAKKEEKMEVADEVSNAVEAAAEDTPDEVKEEVEA